MQAVEEAKDLPQAEAELTKLGLSPEGLTRLVQEGRLSLQDRALLNEKFNSGAPSYAARQQGQAAQTRENTVQDLHLASDPKNFTSWQSQEDPQRNARLKAKAKELGIPEADLRRRLETQRLLDWSRPSSQASHELQSNVTYGAGRALGLLDLAEPARTLPDGSVIPHPEVLADRAAFDQAIDSAAATPQAKAAAKAKWDEYHTRWLTSVRPMLEKMQTLPGVESYMQWRDRMQDAGGMVNWSEEQKAEKYLQEQKGRDGFRKLADNISSNLIAGSHDILTGIYGTAALLTGSTTMADMAAAKAGEADALTGTLEITGNDSLGDKVIGGVTRALPGLAATEATGGLAGGGTRLMAGSQKLSSVVGGAAAFTQSAGSTFTDLYRQNLESGLSADAALKAAAPASAAAGLMSAALTKVFPKGAESLRQPATQAGQAAAQAAQGAVREAMRAPLKSALRELAEKAAKGGLSIAKGAADEVPEELLDSAATHFITEMSAGKTAQEATASYLEQLPQNALVAAVLGGGAQAVKDGVDAHSAGGPLPLPPPPTQGGEPQGNAPTQQPQGNAQQQSNAQPQNAPSSLQTPPANEQQPQGNAQPQSTPPAAVQQQTSQQQHTPTADHPTPPAEPQPQTPPPGQQQEHQQQQPPAGQATPPPGSTDAPAPAALPDTTTPASADPATTTPPLQDSTTPSAAPTPKPPPTTDEAVAAHKTATRLKAQGDNLTPQQSHQLDTAERTVARAQIGNLTKKQEVIARQGRDLHPTEARALADAQARLQQPEVPPPAVPPRPAQSVERSKQLIANVAKMPPQAQAHPQVQADLAQAQRVVAEDTVARLQAQQEPPTDAQHRELTQALQALGDVNANAETAVVPMPGLRFPANDPGLLQQHQSNLARKQSEPRDKQAEAQVQEQAKRVQDPVTGTQAARRRIESKAFKSASPVGGTHVNEANRLRSNDGEEVLHKPAAGQAKEKNRAGIAPETTGKREVAASEVTEALGLDLVPPTTMITHGGRHGSAQMFQAGMIDGAEASKPPYSIKRDPNTKTPAHLPEHVAENWQLIDDLLMHGDRHPGNYMLRMDQDNNVVEVALIDNGYSLPANTGVVEKRFPGPKEGGRISAVNQARLRHIIDGEETLRHSLSMYLEPEALDGLFARAKALLARGTYGNFTIDEINAHLPPEKRRKSPVSYNDFNQ